MTFQDVLAANGFALEREGNYPRFGLGELPTLPRHDVFYRQLEGQGRCTVSFYDAAPSVSLLCSLQVRPNAFSFIGYWESPELAAVELRDKLLTSNCLRG